MRRAGFSLFVALAIAAPAASVGNDSKKKLRALVVVPPQEVSLSFAIRTDLDLPELLRREDEWPKIIATLRKQLRKSPDDTDARLLLGRYLNASDQDEAARQEFAQAADRLRMATNRRSPDGRSQVKLAQALVEAGQFDQAEQVLRAAAAVATNDWEYWVQRGTLLGAQAAKVLGGLTNMLFAAASKAATGDSALLPAPEQTQPAESLKAEAERCLAQAITLAPENPGPYLARIRVRSGQWPAFDFARPEFNPNNSFRLWVRPDTCDDLRAAARLIPTNLSVLIRWIQVAALGEAESLPGEGNLFARLPETRQQYNIEALRLLDPIARQTNARAAEATICVGTVHLVVTGDLPNAEAAFRRAVQLDPADGRGWDGLVSVAARREDPQKVVAACEERLKHVNSTRNRVAVAKACSLAGQKSQALRHARQAVKSAPADMLTRASLGAVLLRWSETDAQVREALAHLEKAASKFDSQAIIREDAEFGIALGLNLAIGAALRGDSETARRILAQLEAVKFDDEGLRDRLRDVQLALNQ